MQWFQGISRLYLKVWWIVTDTHMHLPLLALKLPFAPNTRSARLPQCTVQNVCEQQDECVQNSGPISKTLDCAIVAVSCTHQPHLVAKDNSHMSHSERCPAAACCQVHQSDFHCLPGMRPLQSCDVAACCLYAVGRIVSGAAWTTKSNLLGSCIASVQHSLTQQAHSLIKS